MPIELAQQFKEDYKKVNTYLQGQEVSTKYLDKAKEAELDPIISLFEGINEYLSYNFAKVEKLLSIEVEENEYIELKDYFLGMNMIMTNDFKRAVNYIKESLERNPQSELLWKAMGRVLSRRRKLKDAISCYRKACNIDPNYGLALFELSHTLNSVGNYAESQKILEVALQLEKIPQVVAFKGYLYEQKESIEDALSLYHQALDIDPAVLLAVNNLSNLYYDKLIQPQKALNILSEALKINPNDPRILYQYSLILSKEKNYGLANSYLNKALSAFEQQNDKYYISLVKELSSSIDKQISSDSLLKQNESPVAKVLRGTIDQGISDKAFKNKEQFLDFITPRLSQFVQTDIIFEVLRRWNSYTPIIADNYHISKGGGYFLNIQGKGLVVDPGFNFIDNFKGAQHLFQEIDNVLISHSHNDHTADFESILTLLYKYNQEVKGTIRAELAERKNRPIEDIRKEEIEKEFSRSSKKNIIDFYITTSTFKKYSGLIDLCSNNTYKIHPIESGNTIIKISDDIFINTIEAKHHDIISDRDSVGFAFEFKESVLIITGDTGWSPEIEEQYVALARKYVDKHKVLVAHLGGFSEKERFYSNPGMEKDSFYDNHLGRLGLARLIEVLKPNLCFISEFGEELKGNRIKLAKIFAEAFEGQTVVLPADIGLKYDVIHRKIEAVVDVDLEAYCTYKGFVEPRDVKVCTLRKDYSLHYFIDNGSFSESDLIQILSENFERSIK